jgi:hypothetical protein
MEVFGIATRKSRKVRKCDMCHGTISKGEMYERWACADEGRVHDIKVHTHCKHLLSDYLQGETEFTWDGVAEWLRSECEYEHLCEDDATLEEMVALLYAHTRGFK